MVSSRQFFVTHCAVGLVGTRTITCEFGPYPIYLCIVICFVAKSTIAATTDYIDIATLMSVRAYSSSVEYVSPLVRFDLK